MPTSHGSTSGVDLNIWRGDDPELALVTADAHAWADAHPCECEALCDCDSQERD